MTATIQTDLCIIGAGSAGLSIAAGASQMGAKVVLIEGHRMGGDCLNTGCVPSKSLLAAAKVAKIARASGKFGVDAGTPQVDFKKANAHVHDVIATIAPHDSVERFTGLGCTVIEAKAKFTGRDTVEAGGKVIKARRFIVATGSRAAIPPIPGLADVPYMTNETVFENTVLPDHLIIIGGGPIGCEMAQAHRRLGARVTILDAASILPKDDPEAVDVVRKRLIAEGIDIRERIKIARVEKGASGDGITAGIAIVLAGADGTEEKLTGSHLLVAAGRKVNVEGLGLEAAGVDYTPRGITVDARLRTTNPKVYAAGDVAGGYQFTHLAGYHAGIIIRNILFRVPAKANPAAMPWVTYTDPELAHVGLTEAEARKVHGDKVTIARAEFKGNDRAIAEGDTDGFLKVVVGKGGVILGATMVGAQAGELILPWVLAITSKLKIGAMAAIIAPYPTRSEITKRAAGAYYTPTLFSDRTKFIVRNLLKLG
jgi:pyruvate/2-oxoglutarate dehydrogenase complex dihydrolipoamide dehydrogenase (E3) component